MLRKTACCRNQCLLSLYFCHFLSLSPILLYSFHLLVPRLLSSYLISSLLLCFFCASLDRHVQSHHGHHKPFKCKLCPFKSAYVSRLKSHLHKAHTGKHTHAHAHAHTHTHTHTAVTNKAFPGQNSSLLFIVFHIRILCLT